VDERAGESLGPVFEFMPGYETFWAYIPHFVHSPFYVYAYAFGDGLVNALYAVYEEGGDGFQEKYFDMLKAGGSKHHKELLAPFGLDAQRPCLLGQGSHGMIERLHRPARGVLEGLRHLKSAKALPDTYKPVIDDARQLLRRSALTRDSGEVVQDSPETARPKQTRPAAKDIAPSSAPEPAAPVADIAAQPRANSPMQPARPAQPQGARATMQARPPRQLGQTTAMRPGRGGLGFLERTIVVGAFAFVLGLLLMLTLGYVDLDTLLQIVPDSAAQILP
jgi:hypothetical protein